MGLCRGQPPPDLITRERRAKVSKPKQTMEEGEEVTTDRKDPQRVQSTEEAKEENPSLVQSELSVLCWEESANL